MRLCQRFTFLELLASSPRRSAQQCPSLFCRCLFLVHSLVLLIAPPPPPPFTSGSVSLSAVGHCTLSVAPPAVVSTGIGGRPGRHLLRGHRLSKPLSLAGGASVEVRLVMEPALEPGRQGCSTASVVSAGLQRDRLTD